MVVNHIENHQVITNKIRLVNSLTKYYSSLPDANANNFGVFDCTPTTFVVTSGLDTQMYKDFVERFKQLKESNGSFALEKMPDKHCK